MTKALADIGPVVLPEPKPTTLRQKVEWRLNRLLSTPPVVQAMPYPTVELSYWRPERNKAVNFGDELSRTVVELMLARRGATLFDSAPRQRQLLSVGSVLHMARDDAAIWGTGLHGNTPQRDHQYSRLDVRAVRGPVTRRFLSDRGIAVPEVYGDPALLLPALTNGRFKATSEFDVAFVPNLHDMNHVRDTGLAARFPQMNIVDPLRAWDVVVADILRYRLVLASSLHGLIVAEAFGIPAIFIRLTEHEPLLKYQDYYGGTGRGLTYATSIEEGLKRGGVPFDGFDESKLMAAFPYDLWML